MLAEICCREKISFWKREALLKRGVQDATHEVRAAGAREEDCWASSLSNPNDTRESVDPGCFSDFDDRTALA